MTTPEPGRLAPLILAALGLALPACTSLPGTAPEAPAISPAVQAYTDAFNARDADAMGGLMHPDIEWWSVTDAGAELVAMGRETVAGQMEDYFASPSAVTSELSGEASAGPYISTTETARWTGKDGEPQSQAALVVYEVSKDGTIRRVWYYPAVEAEEDR